MNTREERRPSNQHDRGGQDRWDLSRLGAVLPIGRLAGTEIAISYSVFIALAIVAGLTTLLAQQEGNQDLVRTAVVGSTVWISGLIIQFFVALAMAAIAGLRIRGCAIGLTGIELPVHRWRADRTALLCIIVLQVLVTMGAVMWIIGVAGAASLRIDQAPSLGMKDADQIWQAAAWLIWIQAICQATPLPRTLGRLTMMATISLASSSVNVDPQVAWMRRLVRIVGLGLVAASMLWLLTKPTGIVPSWFILALAAGLIWVSSNHRDIVVWMDSFTLSKIRRETGDMCPTLGELVRQWFTDRDNSKRIQRAREKEQSEAVDVSRLDDILQRVQEHGLDSISDEERAVLKRVSETLRDHRRKNDSVEM